MVPQLGFPVPLLGMQPVRLPVLYDDGQLLALAKPVGVLVQEDGWYPRLPVLVEAIRHQSRQGKGEFQRMGIGEEGLWAVTDLDPECHGPVLFARDRDRAEDLRSSLGSGHFTFTFSFLTRGKMADVTLECTLPISRHRHQPRVLVSHTTGKRSSTCFQLEGPVAGCREWTARIAYPRRHQVLLHAIESGLPVLGDERYARDPLPLLSKIKRGYQPKADLEERPLYDGPAYYLKKLDLGNGTVVNCPLPPRWNGLCRQLEKHRGA
ncbi:MAG: hypothetical protein AB3N33_01650 [Puniceicoccaceae bacterium]